MTTHAKATCSAWQYPDVMALPHETVDCELCKPESGPCAGGCGRTVTAPRRQMQATAVKCSHCVRRMYPLSGSNAGDFDVKDPGR